tara:strand:- start:139 stop:270 length:132 start_codon:yes stop_codon:yes gene_type:complete
VTSTNGGWTAGVAERLLSSALLRAVLLQLVLLVRQEAVMGREG